MKKLRFFLALVITWTTGAVATLAAVDDTFTASTTTAEGAPVDVTYKVLTEEGTAGTVQVGANSTVAISTSTSGTLIIPETVTRDVDGATYTYTVVRIGANAFSDCASLTSVSLPSTITTMYTSFQNCTGLQTMDLSNTQITSVWGGLFNGCTNLHTVSLPSSVTEIRYEAFKYCSSLTSIVLPSSLQKIYGGAFANCTALESIDIPASVTAITNIGYSGYNTNYGFPFAGCTSLSRVNITDIAAWANMTFYDNAGNPLSASYDAGHETALYMNGEPITDLVIPEGVTEIKKGTFLYNTAIQAVTIPSTVTRIYNSSSGTYKGYAFYYTENNKNKGCPNLRKVTMNAQSFITNTTKMSSVFGPNITEFVLPEGVTTIGGDKFKSMSNLAAVNIPSTVTEIGYNAFEGTGITSIGPGSNSIELPTGLKYIQTEAFKGCNKLTSVEIPSGVWNINLAAFSGCTNLETVTLPEPADQNSMTKLGNEVFYGCTSLSSIEIPEGFTSIGNFAFQGCTSLAEASLPSTLTSIGNKAFYDCTALDEVTILSTLAPSLGTDAFTNSSGVQHFLLNVMLGSENNYSDYSQYFEFIVGVPIPGQIIFNCGIPYTVWTAPRGSIPGTVGLGSGSIDNPAHGENDVAAEVTVPSTIAYKSGDRLYVFNVTSLEPYAFVSSNVTRINLPATIKTIMSNSLTCFSLERLCLESSDPDVYMDNLSFDGVPSSCKLAVPVGCVDTFRNYRYDGRMVWHDRFNDSDIVEYDDAPITAEIDGIEWKFTVDDQNAKTLRTYSYYMEHKGDPEVINCIPPGNYGIITIPSTVAYNGEDYTVVAIGDNSFNSTYTGLSIHGVKIPETVTSIGALAFYNDLMTQISIPASVTEIGGGAFLMDNLGAVYLFSTNPQSLTADNSPFYSYDGYQPPTLYIPAGTKNLYIDRGWGLYFDNGERIVEMSGDPNTFIYQTDWNVFMALKVLDSNAHTAQVGTGESEMPSVDKSTVAVSIPSVVQKNGVDYTVTSIGAYAFQNCSALIGVEIPNTISSIGTSAFQGCTALESVIANVIMPLSLPEQAFDPLEDGQKRSLIVPYGCLNKYLNSDWRPYFRTISMVNDKTADIATIEAEDNYNVTFAEDLTDANGNGLDLEDAVAAGVYYNLKSDDGEGFDTSDNSLVINNTISEEEMEEIVSLGFDSEVRESIKDVFSGLIVQVDDKGKIEISCKTFGTGVMTVRIGNGAPTQYTSEDEESPISIDFNVSEPTLIYIYASEFVVSGNVKGYRMMEARRINKRGSENSVKIYQLSVVSSPNDFLQGDVNSDGQTTIADVTALVNIILGKDTDNQYNRAAADVNQDNQITIADVTAIVNIILGK